MRTIETIEEILRGYLLEKIAAGDIWEADGNLITDASGNHILLDRPEIPVYVNVPPDPGPERIVIERTGGSLSNHIRYATIAVQSIAGNMYLAAMIHEKAIRWMLEAADLDVIGSVKLNSEYNYTFEAMKEYRYQAVFDIAFYAEEV